MEYYFQDQLRWTFGFDNPNKAAALLATLLPFVWLIYALSWRIAGKFSRGMALVVSALALVLGWGLLIMTFSRGGLLAAVVASCYTGWKTWRRGERTKLRTLISAGLFAAIFFGGLATGAAHRSTQWIEKREGSVDNRLTLWKGALEMIVAIPQGVGTGRSGSVYMQWFQPLENTARYRTLVNSFLTFTVEQGLGIALGSLFLVLLFWKATNFSDKPAHSTSQDAAIGMRASLLAFAVAGFFSTTMEEAGLWIVPVLAILGTMVLKYLGKTSLRWRQIISESLLMTLLIGGVILVSGWWLRSPTNISWRQDPEKRVLVSINPRNSTSPEMEVAVDKQVLGNDYGKLLRRLAGEKGLRLLIGTSTSNRVGRKLVVGNKVAGLRQSAGCDLILIAPETIDDGLAEKLLLQAKTVRIFLASYDEDGRGAFWTEKATLAKREDVEILILEGVGTQVEWAWETVIDQI